MRSRIGSTNSVIADRDVVRAKALGDSPAPGAKKRGPAPELARSLLVYIKQLFTWAVEQHAYGLDRSPQTRLRASASSARRTSAGACSRTGSCAWCGAPQTHLSPLAIEEHVRELMVAHTHKGMSKVYDKWKYREEKRAGLGMWHARLASILAAKADNVVPLRG